MNSRPLRVVEPADPGCALQPLPWPDGIFLYSAAFWSKADADRLYRQLQTEVIWQQHQVRLFGRQVDAPRLSAWHGDPGVEYTYSGHRHRAQPWLPALEEIRDAIEQAVLDHLPGCFNGVLANRYRDGGDGMGWHSDDEPELGPEPVVVSASFGASRRFQLRHRRDQHRQELVLDHGSLLIMAGASQRCWQHAVPKTRRPCGERINLTFRRVGSRRAAHCRADTDWQWP